MTELYTLPTAAFTDGQIVLGSLPPSASSPGGSPMNYAAGELAAEEGESTETVNPVLPETHEIFWAAVFFVFLWLAMKYVLLPPIRKLQAARSQKLQDDKDAKDRAEQDYETTMSDYQTALAAARQDANELFEQARSRAQTQRQELVTRASQAVADDRTAATAEIAQARQQAIDSLRPQLRTLAVQAASNVLGQTPSEAQQSAVDRYLAGLGGVGAGSGGAGAGSGGAPGATTQGAGS